MKATLFLAAFLLTIFIFSCTRANNETQDNTIEPSMIIDPGPGPDEENGVPERQPRLHANDSVPAPTKLQPAPMEWDKKIIKTAELSLEVPDHKKFNGQLHNLIRQSGGYIAEETQRTTAERVETAVAIKVPVGGFETLMNQLAGSEGKLLERKITSQDVTGEVVDTRSRLEAKREVRLKYLEFLKAAKNIDEVLKVQKEISEIQENIEAASGRIEYLSHQAALSTIHLSYYQPVAGYAPENDNPSFSSRVFDSFNSGATWFANLFVGLVSIWPLLLILFGGIFIYRSRVSVAGERRKP